MPSGDGTTDRDCVITAVVVLKQVFLRLRLSKLDSELPETTRLDEIAKTKWLQKRGMLFCKKGIFFLGFKKPGLKKIEGASRTETARVLIKLN